MLEPVSKAPPNLPARRHLHFLLVSGHLLLTATLLLFVYLADRYPDPYSHIWRIVLLHLVSGRLGSVGWGLQLDFDKEFLLFLCTSMDTIILFLLLPLLVFAMTKANYVPYLGPWLVHVNESAAQHKKTIEPFGALGLLAFVSFPLWSTGPLVGSVVGVLLGMRLWIILSAVSIGNLFANAAWIFFWDWLRLRSGTLSMVILITAMVFIIGGIIWRVFRHTGKRPSPPKLDAPAKESAD